MKKIITVILSIILSLGIVFYINKLDVLNFKKTNTSPIKKEKKPEEVWPKETKLSLLSTGDALAHNTLYEWYRESDGTYNQESMFREIKDLVSKYDLAYYNQETVFGGKELGYQAWPVFNTPSSLGDALIKAGFNLVSLATNHSMDMGKTGALNSALWWEEQNVHSTGMASSLEKAKEIKVLEVNGIKYAMLSYTYGTNGIPIPAGHEYLVNLYTDERAKEDIESIRDKVDLLIVAMHWGNEYSHSPNQVQIEQAEYLNSLGVDLILGNHTHCIQPINFINDTLVIYSMGNLISHQVADYWMRTPGVGLKVAIGAFVMMDIIKETNKDDSFKIKFDNVEVLLHFTSIINKDIKVVPFDKVDADNLPFYMKSGYLGYKGYIDVFNKFKDIMAHERVTVIDPFKAIENETLN